MRQNYCTKLIRKRILFTITKILKSLNYVGSCRRPILEWIHMIPKLGFSSMTIFKLGLFTGRIGSDLESSDIRSELVGLKIFGPESDPIIVGFDRVGWNIIGLWSGWIKNMNFSVIFYRIWRVGRSDWMI